MDKNLIIDSNDEIQEKSPNFEKKDSPGSSQKNSASREKTKPNTSNWTKNSMYKNAQIKKPTRRTPNSPLKWSPRKKHDSYLKRKIKHLQETGGMNLTLDETLESANLHFTRIAREKIAAKESAKRAMEARKSAMVEASWCRILNAARIKNKEAEMELEKAQTRASEAFESARKMGVMMYDRPDSDQSRYGYEIETTGTGTKITASFETPFEVDKQVAHAVKKAFLQLANKEEFKGLLWKIRENPKNNNTGLFDISSESGTCLVGTMLQRLKGLKEEELVSLAEIVATCGLSDALRLSVDERYELGLGFQETGTKKKEVEDSSCVPSLDKLLVKRVSKLEREVEEARKQNRNESKENRVTGTDPGSVPGLDCVLVKHMSKLEREVQEAKRQNRNESKENKVTGTDSGSVPGLDCVLVKHMSKLEREVQEAKRRNRNECKENKVTGTDSGSVPGLDCVLVKHMSKLEREVQEAKIRNRNECKENKVTGTDSGSVPGLDCVLVKHMSKLEREVQETKRRNRNECKENKVTGTDSGSVPGLDCVLVKHMSKLEREVQEAKRRNMNECKENKVTGTDSGSVPGLDCVLVKHMSKVEREVQEAKKKNDNSLLKNNESGQTGRESKGTKETGTVGSLGDLLVKRNGLKIQRGNNKFSVVSSEGRGNEFEVKNEILDRKKEREKEMMKYWGDLSLENSIRPCLSRIEQDKIAWKKAEEEKNNSLRAEI